MNRICDLRREAGMKQTDLAVALAVTRQAISKWETGIIDLNTDVIARMCELFSCSADYLLGLSTQRTAQISDADAALVSAYHAAPESVREGIDALLRPYGEENKKAAAG